MPRQPRRLVRPLPRALHPVAWWVWALGLATAASRTTNPLLLLLVATVAGVVVSQRRGEAPWARSFGAFLRLGLLVVAIRLGFHVIFGSPIEGPTTLLRLPQVPLPDWAAGIRLGGRVSLEGLAAAAYDGLRLATLLLCLGAANALANPHRLLRAVPGALYEVGVAAVVGVTFAPQLVQAVSRVRAARRLRGRRDRGLRGLRSVAMPVLEDALESSLALAAAMDSRGYGRHGGLSRRARRTTGALVLTGLVGTCLGLYGLLTGGAEGWGGAVLGLPTLLVGAAAAVAGTVLAGRRTRRTVYRPDPWQLPEWLTAGLGVLVAGVFVVVALRSPTALAPSTMPLAVPDLPLLPTLAVLAAGLPAVLTPDASEEAR
ncbi:MAG: CbiQ family ECF transporter T component [Actinomycetales bacterium]